MTLTQHNNDTSYHLLSRVESAAQAAGRAGLTLAASSKSECQMSTLFHLPTDQFDHWRRRLAGAELPLHADQPRPGYYRMRRRGAWVPVCIWLEGGRLIAVAGPERTQVAPEEVWTWCCGHPVSEEAARAAFEGRGWPGDVPSIGHNRPPAETPGEAIERLAETVETWLARTAPLTNEVAANQAANYRDQLRGLRDAVEAARRAAKAPHLEAGRAIDREHQPAIDRAEGVIRALSERLTSYLEASGGEPVGGQFGRRSGLRSRQVVEIVAYDEALAALKDDDGVIAAVTKAAAARLKAGEAVPGARLVTERRA